MDFIRYIKCEGQVTTSERDRVKQLETENSELKREVCNIGGN